MEWFRQWGPVVLQWFGFACALAGELWAVFDRPRGNTITEVVFRSPISLSMMTALLFWAAWHFVAARGKPGWMDLGVIGSGTLLGLLAYYFNGQRKKKPAPPPEEGGGDG